MLRLRFGRSRHPNCPEIHFLYDAYEYRRNRYIMAISVQAEANECNEIGCNLPESEIVQVALQGLTETFVPVRTALLTRAAEEQKSPDIATVQRSLIAHESINSSISGIPSSTTAFNSTNYQRPRMVPSTLPSCNLSVSTNASNDICNWCSHHGHWEQDCRSKASGRPRAPAKLFAQSYANLVRTNTPNPKFNNKTHNYSSGPSSNRRQDTQNNWPTSQSAIFTAMADNSTS